MLLQNVLLFLRPDMDQVNSACLSRALSLQMLSSGSDTTNVALFVAWHDKGRTRVCEGINDKRRLF